MIITLYKNNDQYLRLVGLKDSKTGAFINNAIVTATMKDNGGTVIPEVSGLSMPSIDATGDYEAIVASTFNPLDSGAPFLCTLVILNGIYREEVTAEVRVLRREQ